jgi:hypothetical protein
MGIIGGQMTVLRNMDHWNRAYIDILELGVMELDDTLLRFNDLGFDGFKLG